MTAASDECSSDPKPWTVTTSREVIRDRWITIRADDCLTADGIEVAPYYVLDYPDWIQVVALDDEDHIILVEQYRHGVGTMSLELPAGGIDPQDPSPVAAAARELEEETGYVGTRWRYFGKLSPNPATHSNFCHTVLGQGVRPGGRLLNDPSERIKVVRVPVQEAVRLAMNGGILSAMQIASLVVVLGAIGKWSP